MSSYPSDSGGGQASNETPDPGDRWDWTVGIVVAPFGLRGEMRTRVDCDASECLKPAGRVALALPDRPLRFADISGVRNHKGQALLKLDGIDTIEDAEPWRGAEVRLRRIDAPPLPEDAHYVSDLIGMEVVTSDGRSIGRLDDVVSAPAHDLLLVGDALIPMVKAIVTAIDADDRRITIDPPEGLLPERLDTPEAQTA